MNVDPYHYIIQKDQTWKVKKNFLKDNAGKYLQELWVVKDFFKIVQSITYKDKV